MIPSISIDSRTRPRIPEFWVEHPIARRILEYIDLQVSTSGYQRAEGLLIVGEPNNGKSFILRKSLGDLTSRLRDPNPEVVQVPIVYIQAPVKANRRDLYNLLGRAVHLPDPDRFSFDRLRARILQAFVDAGVRAIYVDELHHLVAGTSDSCRTVLDDLKFISNELMIPIICAGTWRAYQAIRDDEQYLSRFPPIQLPNWPLDSQYAALLRAIEKGLSLPSGCISSPELGELIWTHSKGLIGRTIQIAWKAHLASLDEGSSAISADHINRAGFKDLPWMLVE